MKRGGWLLGSGATMKTHSLLCEAPLKGFLAIIFILFFHIEATMACASDCVFCTLIGTVQASSCIWCFCIFKIESQVNICSSAKSRCVLHPFWVCFYGMLLWVVMLTYLYHILGILQVHFSTDLAWAGCVCWTAVCCLRCALACGVSNLTKAA